MTFLRTEKIKNFKFDKDTPKNYQIIGYYDTTLKLWYNGWGLYVNKEVSDWYKKSKELLAYSIDIDKHQSMTNIEKVIIRYILTNTKLYISEKKTQLYLILAILIYLSKAKRYGYSRENDILTYAIEI